MQTLQPSEQSPAVISYHGKASGRQHSGNPAGIALLIWSPFLFVMSIAFGIMAASIVALFFTSFVNRPFDWNEFPVTLSLLPLALLPGLAALALFRSGLGAIRMAHQLLRGQLPPLHGTLQKINTMEAILYVVAAFTIFVAFMFSPAAIFFTLFFLLVAISLTITRILLNRALAGYLRLLSPASTYQAMGVPSRNHG